MELVMARVSHFASLFLLAHNDSDGDTDGDSKGALVRCKECNSVV